MRSAIALVIEQITTVRLCKTCAGTAVSTDLAPEESIELLLENYASVRRDVATKTSSS